MQEFEAREAEASLSCPLECVREVYNYSEFEKVLHEAEKANELVNLFSVFCLIPIERTNVATHLITCVQPQQGNEQPAAVLNS